MLLVSRCFLTLSFHPPNSPLRWMLLSPSTQTDEETGPGRHRHLPEVTQPLAFQTLLFLGPPQHHLTGKKGQKDDRKCFPFRSVCGFHTRH